MVACLPSTAQWVKKSKNNKLKNYTVQSDEINGGEKELLKRGNDRTGFS